MIRIILCCLVAATLVACAGEGDGQPGDKPFLEDIPRVKALFEQKCSRFISEIVHMDSQPTVKTDLSTGETRYVYAVSYKLSPDNEDFDGEPEGQTPPVPIPDRVPNGLLGLTSG